MAEPWEWVQGKIPVGTQVFDAHTHVGMDIDGRAMTAAGLKARMEAANVHKSVIFPLNDPNARDDFSGPNEVVWAAYEEYPDSFVPFFRLNPHKSYDVEFGRCMKRGFRMRRIVEPLLPTVDRLPNLRLVLGHCAMVEVLTATRAFADHPNVLFETSVVKTMDLYLLFCSLEPARVCYGSDIPYGDLPSTLHTTLRAADAAGLSEEELAGVLSGTIRRWFA